MRKFVSIIVLALLTACNGCVPFFHSRVTREESTASVYKIRLDMTVDASSLGGADQVKTGGSGTAWVAANEDGVTYLITAGHVCNTGTELKGQDMFGNDYALPILERSYTLIDKNDQEFTALTIARDNDGDGIDTCVITSKGDFGPPLPISNDDPAYGSRGWYIGAPAGLWGGGIAGIYEMTAMGRGQVFGGGHDSLAFSSAEAAPGASGSPIIFNGRVVGMLTQVARRFQTLTTGIPHEVLKSELDKAIRKVPLGS